ncbi:MAG: hypothetical protein PWQ59_2352, partial [Thermoanaerobacterium sp.]|nr:hypothetical protein [Thermoanaerobacterium sp.]
PTNKYILYIPHGSDETAGSANPHGGRRWLYIPHGSDETYMKFLKNHGKGHFISHMVQMKLDKNKREKLFFSFFISHMVQMKPNCQRT